MIDFQDPCSDCGAEPFEGELAHLAGCPIGESLDTATDLDRQWFADHPTESEYWRPISYEELDVVARELGRALPHPPAGFAWYIRVEQLSPGLRQRHLESIILSELTTIDAT